MKVGDMVRWKDTIGIDYLYGDFDSKYNFSGPHITFKLSHVGIIIESKIDVTLHPYPTYHKLLTSNGIGWARENHLEAVK